VSQPLVLAIEPDLRQANIVKRIVREKALADVAVVDSLDAAIEAMRTAMPDVLLLSALMSPRDEDELITHLKTLEHAGHLQTHTIPQLASALRPEKGAARGLLSAFRRKKEQEPAASGCDPDLFAEEIILFLKRAAEKKRELQYSDHAAPDMRPSPAGAKRAKSSEVHAPLEAPGGSSSWSSPFEWKPANPSSLISNPYSRIVSPEEAVEAPEVSMPPAEPLIPASVAAASFSPDLDSPERISFGAESPAQAFVEAPLYVPAETSLDLDMAFVGAAPVHAEAPMNFEAAAAVDTTVHEDAFAHVSEPTHDDIFAHVEPPAHVDTPVHADVFVHVDAPVYVYAPIHVPAPLYGEAETPVYVDAPIHVDAPASMRESGPRDKRPTSKDRRLGVLASWMRSERTPPAGSGSADDLRGLLGSLAIPTGVAAVAYPRGVRIRRVRVPKAREPHVAEGAGAVILSKKLLAEQRERRTPA
jgi:CheY-like chemotaxis protein